MKVYIVIHGHDAIIYGVFSKQEDAEKMAQFEKGLLIEEYEVDEVLIMKDELSDVLERCRKE